MSNKKFIERLNKELDSMGMPEPALERVDTLAKLLKINKYKAGAILEGHIDAKDPVLQILARELGVSTDWLLAQP